MKKEDCYYHRKLGEKSMGPTPLFELMEMSSQGKLPMGTQVCRYGKSEWVGFSEVVKAFSEYVEVEPTPKKDIPATVVQVPAVTQSAVIASLGFIGWILLAMFFIAAFVAISCLIMGSLNTLFYATASIGLLVSGVLFFALQEVLIRLREIAESLKK